MNPLAVGIVLLACTWAAGAGQVTKPQPVLPPGDRFLFVVDTSAGMAKLAQACCKVVFELTWSGLGGYMQPGDTYGLWTFNDKVGRNRLPMQVWQSNSVELASAASRFLRDQPYQNSSHPEVALATLKPTVQLVQDLVVVLITDGRAPIAGTPFDAAIQAACKQRAAHARKLRQPLLVVLTARGGQWVRWSVHLPGEKLDLPQRVSSVLASGSSAHPGSQAGPPASAPTVQPTNRVQATSAVAWMPIQSAPATGPSPVAPASNPVEPTLSLTLPAGTETPAEPTGSEAASTSNAAPLTPQRNLPANPLAQPVEPPQPTPPLDQTPQQTTAEPSAQPPPAQPQPTEGTEAPPSSLAFSPGLLPARTAAPPVVLRPKNTAIVSAQAQPHSAPGAWTGSTAPVGSSPKRTVHLPGVEPEPVAARERAVAPAGAVPAVAGPPPARSGPGATAAGPEGFAPWVMLAIGLGLLATAFIVTVVFLRRTRPQSRQSIISGSLHRTRGGSS